ncbi:MAG: type II toxin-antitoxin system VapC family toxin [Saprospiraceae bacterium]|nr:type II toxin-antitoxin system VapC family toxin [Saprospiraceae bacterium]
MAQQQYLIDTNAVIDFLSNKLPETAMYFMNDIFDDVPNISVVTKIELLGFNAPDEHYQLLTSFVNDTIVLDLSEKVVDECIKIRKNKNKLPDAIIAATAMVHELILITRNISDFNSIEGLQVINSYHL